MNIKYEPGKMPINVRHRKTTRSALHQATVLSSRGLGLFVGIALCASPARAFNLYSGSYAGDQLEINLSTTLEYSNIFRVGNPSAFLINSPSSGIYQVNTINGDDGDRSFRHGLVSNEFDITPVFDLKWGNLGVHVSGEAYLNTVYLKGNQNNSPSTFNPISTSDNQSFTTATRNINGENARLLDAFVDDGWNFGSEGQQTFSLKVGRQTLLWGQSLYFSENGISAGQAPLDVIKGESLPNPQTQQIILPVGQVVATYQPDSTYTFQGYYQFEYEHDVFQGVGAYFSSADVLDKGGQRLFVEPGFGIPRTKDNLPEHQNGQFGASVQAQFGNYDLGLYGLRYDSKTPVENVNLAASGFPPPLPGVIPTSYNLVYPRDIQVYGASVSTNIGAANVAAEVSGRRHMPLFTLGTTDLGTGNANSNPLYPVGNTVAAQTSFIYVSPGIPFDPGGISWSGEAAWNHVVSVDVNQANLAPHRNQSAGAFDISAAPTYYSVLPNLELQFPVSIRYNLFGRSQVDASMNHGTGTLDVGVTAIYLTTWTAGLTYQDYLGAPDPVINALADRSYIAFNIEHTF